MVDLFGRELRKRQLVVAVLAKVVRLHGYEQVEVPLVERATSFSEEVVGRSPWPEWDSRGCFHLRAPDYPSSYEDAPDHTDVLLVPEGTISVTRWIGCRLAESPDMIFPVKLFYDMPCFRNEVVAELTGTKRRQFTQFGLEILGAEPGNSDVEAVYLITRCLEELGVAAGGTRVRVGDVGVFNRLVELSGLGPDAAIQVKEVLDAMAECKAGKAPERASGLLGRLAGVLDAGGVSRLPHDVWMGLAHAGDSVSFLRALHDSVIDERLDDLARLVHVLEALGVRVETDLCVVRSHEYYTGIVFEIDVVTEEYSHVEVGGGGRYDKLVGHFVPDGGVDRIPATGFAFGVERLVELLDHLDLLPAHRVLRSSIGLSESSAEKLVASGPGAQEYLSAVRIAAADRAAGHPVDIYLGVPDQVERYAESRKIPQTVSCEPQRADR
ncbi:ATP phosphoribosyltransferase regulatory subunit [Saccharothrix violaceirubra]|uniref:Histidyl-tRNA synthetase n=1 Tax=Saccharothrix violaceirubra TaxID=413306 RepID=A0A7W7WUK4_9PSEU|nr:ATP phosphoribosyltransferase regulatory subunit [Saccharothrix violaceirubra]MBB4963483.1 histidyl-tRNA synthetase [Saccharothrix violaceirubra]